MGADILTETNYVFYFWMHGVTVAAVNELIFDNAVTLNVKALQHKQWEGVFYDSTIFASRCSTLTASCLIWRSNLN